MPALTLKYRPIRYVEDPFKDESRNIGVFAYEGNTAYFRLMGAVGGRLDTTLFSALSKTAGESSWVFAEWVEWFRALTQAFRDQPESMMKRLEGLSDSDSGICVGKEAELDGIDENCPENAVEWLYTRLVTEPSVPRREIQKSQIEHLLRVTELKFSLGFEQDIEVEFTPSGKPPIRVQLPYAVTEPPRLVFKTVRFQTGGAALARQVNDAIMTFSTVVEHGFAEKDRCVLLSDKPAEEREGDYKRLSEYCKIIDISAHDAVSQLNLILHAK